MATNERKRPRVYRIYSDNQPLTDTEADVSALKLKMNSIAEPFAVTESYNAGEYVWYNNVLYVFTADHAAGSWTGSDAEQVVLTEEMAEQITELKDEITAVFPTDIESGALAHFEDGADNVPIKDLSITINYKPAGWTGANVTRAGKNLLRLHPNVPESSSYGVTTTNNYTDNTVRINGTPSQTAWRPFNGYSLSTGDDATPFRGKQMTVAVFPSMTGLKGVATVYKEDGSFVNVATGSNNFAGSVTFTMPEDAYRFRMQFRLEAGTVFNNVDAYITLALGTTVSEEKYNGVIIPITFPSSAGTVYGGTLDVTSGVLTSILNSSGSALDTPQTYQLTPTEVRTLLGINNIWADTGDTEVEYRADTTLYIDKKISAQQKLISGVETSYTATKNYSIGDYVIVNDTLYKVTAAIASGATITPGTNATATTVAEQLILLAQA